ncbi:odorant receptor 43a-like [Nilaparvata lugens]|uniref:odorant receptor 43a-like n=1 Tax=Nilaparvata lugens TaxID=108931 RepID=UPI00193D391B|nr:odorant receptor 43a-like [Nilaparvata lugens]
MFFFTNLILFTIYQNGQRIFNQNDRLRKSLLEIPWTGKPRWLRQTMHIMLTQANRDVQIKPYGIFVLNYMSFKDLMKFTFSVGNVLYRRKQLTTQT